MNNASTTKPTQMVMQIRALFERFWAPMTLLVLIAITVLSLMPLPELPNVSGSDKAHHLIAYGALMMPVFLIKSRWRYPLFGVFLLWGGAIELVQPWVNRYGEWLDFFANTLGLLCGAVMAILLRLKIFK